MRNLKKFLALALAMIMTFALMLSASAAPTSFEEQNKWKDESILPEFKEDVEVMTGMGVIKGFGDTGTFAPTNKIKRSEMAAIVYRLATGDVSDSKADVYKKYSKFSDVDQNMWYAGYIGYCADAGYIQGYPNGTFRPNDEVTGYAAMAMILRAMGYNEAGHNFTGDGWKAETGATATQRGMLVNVNKTNYANTLGGSADRQLIAEIAFQGATLEMVQWTNAYGYQTTGMATGTPGQGAKNPSLGYQYFGLVNYKGVIVGNAATGEKPLTVSGTSVPVTKIGFDLVDGKISNDVDSKTSDAYAYLSDSRRTVSVPEALGLSSVNVPNNDPYNVTLTFKWDSGLDKFGHAVDVWYDYRGASNTQAGALSFRDVLDTYAVFDRVTSATVETTNSTWSDSASIPSWMKNSEPFWNYAFGPTSIWSTSGYADNVSIGYYNARTENVEEWPEDGNNAAVTTVANFTSPVRKNNSNDPIQYYLVINNSGNETVKDSGHPDLVVSLNLTFSQVTQDNNTTNPLSTGIITANGDNNGSSGSPAANSYFNRFDYIRPANANVLTAGQGYSNMANSNITSAYKGDLGDYVAAITVTGTATTASGLRYGGTSGYEDNNGNAKETTTIGTENNSEHSSYYYNMTKLTKTVSGRVMEINRNTQSVWIQGHDGELKRSKLADAVDGSFMGNAYVNAPNNYIDATFYLDEDGNYLFWVPGVQGTEFVYGTYMDYTTEVGSGSYKYPFIYVDQDGKANQRYDDVTRMTFAHTYDNNTVGTVETITGPRYTDDLNLPKRTTTDGNSAGFQKGAYIGYILDKASNTLTAVTDSYTGANPIAGQNGVNFVQAGPGPNPLTNNVVTTDFDSGDTTIYEQDSTVGATKVGNANNLFLTNETKFVVVSGAGSDSQKATTYVGLNNLLTLNGAMRNSKVTLHTYTGNGADNSYLTRTALTTDPYKMVYYSVKPFQYAQSYDPSAYAVDTVFIPEALVQWDYGTGASDLYFVGNPASSVVNTNGTVATKFTFYKQGTDDASKNGESLWIMGRPDAGNSLEGYNDAEIVASQKDVFYRLMNSGATAHDGQPIYRIAPVAVETVDPLTRVPVTAVENANKIIIGTFYDGDLTDGTGWFNRTDRMAFDDEHRYVATTYSDQVAYIGGTDTEHLYNVGNAGVKNLNTKLTINSLADLNQASSLYDNVGIAVSCILRTDASRTVDYIFVNY